MEAEKQVHPIPAIAAPDSRILILGSFPSVKSREAKFFYGHPQNRFWKMIAAVCKEETPDGIPAKTEFLLRNHIAVWDTIRSCTITGSSDSSIKDVVPNPIPELVEGTSIKAVFCNGKASYNLYKKYVEKDVDLPVFSVPSTSPANAAWSLERLTEAWSEAVSPYLFPDE